MTIALVTGLFTTACKKVDDLTETAVTKDGEIAPALVTSINPMTLAQADNACDATARAVAKLVANDANFRLHVRQVCSLQVTGDYEYLLADLGSQGSSVLGYDTHNQLLSQGWTIGGTFLNAYSDPNSGVNYWPQLYAEEFENFTSATILTNATIPVIVPMTSTFANSSNSSGVGYMWVNNALVTVNVDEDYGRSNPIWFINISERVLQNGNKKAPEGDRVETINDVATGPCAAIKRGIRLDKISIGEQKERWGWGKAEIYYSIVEYRNNDINPTTHGEGVKHPPFATQAAASNYGNAFRNFAQEQLINNTHVRRRDLHNAIQAGGYIVINPGLTLLNSWITYPNSCDKRSRCFLVIYEDDQCAWFGKYKMYVPFAASVTDWTDDDESNFLQSSFPSHNLSNVSSGGSDYDYDNISGGGPCQGHLRINTDHRTKSAETGLFAPYAIIALDEAVHTLGSYQFLFPPVSSVGNGTNQILNNLQMFGPAPSNTAATTYNYVAGGAIVDLTVF
jgi:hypothetical protein